jgi:threonine dehydratase
MDKARLPAEAALAAQRISPFVRETPLDSSPYFSELTGANVFMKLENLQHTCSFKLRGAFNKLLTMSDEQKASGCVTASSGNHGAATAYALSKLGVTGIIFVPEQTSPTKLDAIKRSGGDVRLFGTDGVDTELHARQYAQDNGMTYISPYNDAEVIAGQGTIGVELARQLDNIDLVFIAVGGGGLISGVGSFLKSVKPSISIVACQPENSAVMTRSVEAGEILDMPSEPTLSDGTAGGIEPGAITFDICREVIDIYITVSEEQIAEAMRGFIDSHHQLLEGAAGVAIAGLMTTAGEIAGKNAAVIVCGGNISRETLKKVI